jgi:hypothetical protein
MYELVAFNVINGRRTAKQAMRREEAVNIVKEIGESCRLLNPREINLEASSWLGIIGFGSKVPLMMRTGSV